MATTPAPAFVIDTTIVVAVAVAVGIVALVFMALRRGQKDGRHDVSPPSHGDRDYRKPHQ